MKTISFLAFLLFVTCSSSKDTTSTPISNPDPVEETNGTETDHSEVSPESTDPVPATTGPVTTSTGTAETPKEVFNRLKRALGLSPDDAPHFVLDSALPSDAFVMAMIKYDPEQTIYLEQTAVDICNTVDPVNGLAFFLGHELAHFKENHEMKNHYVKGFHSDIAASGLISAGSKNDGQLRTQVAKDLFNSMTTIAEAEADLDGGFIAYLAGYKTIGVGEALLRKSYQTYDLDTVGTNYPDLSERIAIVKQTEKKLEELIHFFEMGNYLIALGFYDQALIYYQNVLKSFQSREIYNNIGVLYTLKFLHHAEQKKVKYVFPVELDVKSRAGVRGVDQKKLNSYLHKAILLFNQASIRDKDYPVAHLNRGCAHTLLGMFVSDSFEKEAHFANGRAAALSSMVLSKKDLEEWKGTETNAHILLGIIEAEEGQKDLAQNRFDNVLGMDLNNDMATYNKKKLLGQSASLVDKSAEAQAARAANKALKIEFIDGLRNFNVDPDKSYTLQEDEEMEMYFEVKKLANSIVLINDVTIEPDFLNQQSVTKFQITDLDYPRDKTTKQGIKLGDTRKQIVTAYKMEPDSEIPLAQGRWLLYKKQQIIFQVDQGDKLTRWCVYR